MNTPPSSSVTTLAHAFNTPTKVTEFDYTPSYCICQNSSHAFYPHLVHVPISWLSKWPHFEMAFCWTFSAHPQYSNILHTCQPS
jgi:hypothetical protein